MCYAHSANPLGEPQTVRQHLSQVSTLAAEFAAAFGAEDEARVAGLLHDLGKYGDLFQRRLQGLESGLDHWSPGAWIAATKCHAFAAAFAIHGHHCGLEEASKTALRRLDPRAYSGDLRLSESDAELLWQRLLDDDLRAVKLGESLYPGPGGTGTMLDLRMLFSALVDADYLDTEQHFGRGSEGRERPEGSVLQADRALEVLRLHVRRLAETTDASSAVGSLRSDLFQACLGAGSGCERLWTLSAPTGSGKTLAMMAFALRHAAERGLRRVIVVIPYLSILDQTASVYRKVFTEEFGDRYVLEHHSLANTRPTANIGSDAERSSDRQLRMLTENWDAPIILTTSVQFLESLFADRPSTCRKLHRVAESVVLFDEVQTLPLGLAVPTLQTLSRLARRFGTSVVFSTATQPAFEHLDKAVRQEGNQGWSPTEIANPSLHLFARARRTRVCWPNLERRLSWAELAEQMAATRKGLCILNLRRHAVRLASLLREAGVQVDHLSTYMCPAHRERVLKSVRARLDEDGAECHLVSTQCIEAGVDVDFPVAYRAFGPLDAIAQAAGRVNRRGLQRECGDVHVFLPEAEGSGREYPDDGYAQAAAVTRMLLISRGADQMDIHDPALFETYYHALYDLARPENRGPELRDAILRQHFGDVARLYRVIDQTSVNVLVPYGDGPALAEEVRRSGLSTGWVRRARPYTVNLPSPKPTSPVTARLEAVKLAGGDLATDWFLYTEPLDYDAGFGLVLPH